MLSCAFLTLRGVNSHLRFPLEVELGRSKKHSQPAPQRYSLNHVLVTSGQSCASPNSLSESSVKAKRAPVPVFELPEKSAWLARFLLQPLRSQRDGGNPRPS